MTPSQVSKLKAGVSQIRRKPSGYYCKLMAVDHVSEKARIYDPQSDSVFWCNFDTLIEKWDLLGKRKG